MKKRSQHVPQKKKKKPMRCKLRGEFQGYFWKLISWAFLSQFSLHFGEKFLVGPKTKHLSLIIYFPLSPSNQTHSKNFSFQFSLQSFPFTLFHLQTNTPLVSSSSTYMQQWRTGRFLFSLQFLSFNLIFLDLISHHPISSLS